jgi:hypothetical protein
MMMERLIWCDENSTIVIDEKELTVNDEVDTSKLHRDTVAKLRSDRKIGTKVEIAKWKREKKKGCKHKKLQFKKELLTTGWKLTIRCKACKKENSTVLPSFRVSGKVARNVKNLLIESVRGKKLKDSYKPNKKRAGNEKTS